MKYANLYWQSTDLGNGGYRAVNIGDNLQFMVMDYLFQTYLPSEKPVKLQVSELKMYTGEPLRLPLNWSLFDINYMDGDKIAISQDIIPVFLAMTIESGTFQPRYLNEYNFSYLRKYEPIGCRDEYTMKTLEHYGVKAYLNGCLTSVLPKLEMKGERKKVFLVDVPIEAEKFIPKDIREHSEIMTQQYYFSADMSIDKILDTIKSQYCKYAREAKLVVTSRLHVASPCMAMGIPVVFTKNQIDARFGWIDNYIPLYDLKSYEKINWEQGPVEYEEDKKRIIKNYVQRLTGIPDLHLETDLISDIFKSREGRQYINFRDTVYYKFEKAKEFLRANYKREDEFLYSIWGYTDSAESFYNYMCIHYPKAHIKDVIDTYKNEEFHGIKTKRPEMFILEKSEIVFVLPVKASNVAKEFFTDRGVSDRQYVCCGQQFITIK